MTNSVVNPFEVLSSRLSVIEEKLATLIILGNEIKSLPDAEEDIGNIQLAEKITNLAKPTIYALVAHREIPFMKKGKKLYFSKKELINWIKTGRKYENEDSSIDAIKLLVKRNKRKGRNPSSKK
jgi:excisionase family DNA binding protein